MKFPEDERPAQLPPVRHAAELKVRAILTPGQLKLLDAALVKHRENLKDAKPTSSGGP